MVWRKFHRTWPIPVAHQHGCQKRHSSWQRSSSPSKWVSFSAPCVTGCLDGSCGTALREGSAWGMWKNAAEAVGVDLALWWTWHNRQRWHIVGRLTLSVLAVAVMWTLKWCSFVTCVELVWENVSLMDPRCRYEQYLLQNTNEICADIKPGDTTRSVLVLKLGISDGQTDFRRNLLALYWFLLN